jgi:hypothetical protein
MFNGGKRQHQNGIVYLPTRAAVGSNVNLPNIFSLNIVLLQRLQPTQYAWMHAQHSADEEDKKANILMFHSVNLSICP